MRLSADAVRMGARLYYNRSSDVFQLAVRSTLRGFLLFFFFLNKMSFGVNLEHNTHIYIHSAFPAASVPPILHLIGGMTAPHNQTGSQSFSAMKYLALSAYLPASTPLE